MFKMWLKLLKSVRGTHSNIRYTEPRERHIQWDTKTGAIYKIGRKPSYNIRIHEINNNNDMPI
jgi:hypothetical protein